MFKSNTYVNWGVGWREETMKPLGHTKPTYNNCAENDPLLKLTKLLITFVPIILLQLPNTT